jgi:hypothetical protein
MKKAILSAIIMIGLASCGKKDNSSNAPTPKPSPNKSNYATMKVNGVAVELYYTPLWLYSSGVSGAGNQMYGYSVTEDKKTNDRRNFLLNVHQDDFVVGKINKIGVGYKSEIIYFPEQVSIKSQYKASKSFAKSSATFTITKITDIDGTKKKFYGTFSGTFVNVDGDSIVITEGKIIE